MRRVAFAAVAAVLAAAVASCNDKPGPVDPVNQFPSGMQLSKGAAGQVTICHAAGTAANPRFGPVTVSNAATSTHFDDRGTPRAGHEQDYLVTARTPCPPPATPGELNVCKVGAGIASGTAFTILINGVTETVPAGQCVTRLYRVGTRVTVTEPPSTGTWLSAFTLVPAIAGTTDMVARTANVVVGTDAATVTFTNTPTTLGVIVICKVGGMGIEAGTPFSFQLDDSNGEGAVQITDVPAGAAPAGSCTAPIAWDPTWTGASTDGQVWITESVLRPGVVLTGVSVTPAANSLATDLSRSRVRVQVVPNQITTATFTNAVAFIVVCKVAGLGVSVGTPFSFQLDDSNGEGAVQVTDVPAGAGPAGTCTAPIAWGPTWTGASTDGQVWITEGVVPAGVSLADISVSPAANLLATDLSRTRARVQLVPNQITTVTFTNAVSLIVVCKVAGAGISVGTPFSFFLEDSNKEGGIPINDLPAGAGPAGTCSAPIAWDPTWEGASEDGQVWITESVPAGVSLTNIGVSPVANVLATELNNSRVRVKTVPNQTTTVTFTNAASQ